MSLIPEPTNIVQGGFSKNSAIASNIVALSKANLDQRVMLFATRGSTAGVSYLGFQSLSGATDGPYQVTTSKTLYCLSVNWSTNSTANALIFGYSTATFSNNTTTPPTGLVLWKTGDAATQMGFNVASGGMATREAYPLFLKFPANSFPLVEVVTAGGVEIWMDCVEL